MIKEVKLYRYSEKPGFYCMGTDPRKTKPKDIALRKVLCFQFVKDFFLNTLPEEIDVYMSNEPLLGGKRFQVMRVGYYRWNWRSDVYWKGMTVAGEEFAAKFYPDLAMTGDEVGNLWVRVVC